MKMSVILVVFHSRVGDMVGSLKGINMSKQLNLVAILETTLTANLQRILKDKLFNKAIEAFKKEVEPEIDEMISMITVDGVESIRNHLQIRDEIAVYINGIEKVKS